MFVFGRTPSPFLWEDSTRTLVKLPKTCHSMIPNLHSWFYTWTDQSGLWRSVGKILWRPHGGDSKSTHPPFIHCVSFSVKLTLKPDLSDTPPSVSSLLVTKVVGSKKEGEQKMVQNGSCSRGILKSLPSRSRVIPWEGLTDTTPLPASQDLFPGSTNLHAGDSR